MKFMLLHYVDETAESTPEEVREDQRGWRPGSTTPSAGASTCMGASWGRHGCGPSRDAATVRTRDGELLVTGGPFAVGGEYTGNPLTASLAGTTGYQPQGPNNPAGQISGIPVVNINAETLETLTGPQPS